MTKVAAKTDTVRVFVYNATVAHLVAADRNVNRHPAALCGVSPRGAVSWYGLASNAERITAIDLPTCKTCVSKS